MTDEEQNKSSLEGRGREIMGGSSDDATDEEAVGGWLPRAKEGADETPEFEDEEAVMKWMEVDPEEHRPTTQPETPLIDTEQKRSTSDMYPVPDFDAIFAESEAEPEAPEPQEPEEDELAVEAQPEATGSLEEIFTEEDASFDEIFGDVVDIDGEPVSTPITLPDVDTQELPLPGASRFARYSDEPSDISPELDEILQDSVLEVEPTLGAENDIPEPEEASDGLIVDDFGTEPAPRADRRSRELATELGEAAILDEEFDDLLDEMTDDVEAVAEPVDDWMEAPEPAEAELGEATAILDEEFDDLPADTSAVRRTFDLLDEMTDDVEAVEPPTPEILGDWEEAPEPVDDWPEAELGEATAILDEEFDDVPADTSAVRRTFDLLDEMTDDVEAVEPSEPESVSEAAAFVSMLERETVTEIVDEIDEELGAEPEEEPEPEFPIDLPEEDVEEDRLSEMVEHEVAARAMEEPLEVVGIEEAEPTQESAPFALPPVAEDTQPALATEPLTKPAFGEFAREEAVPLGEDDQEIVNLSMAALHRSALDTITPTEPETLSEEYLFDEAEEEFDEALETAEDIDDVLEAEIPEDIEHVLEAEEEDFYPEEVEPMPSTDLMVAADERQIRRPDSEILPGSVVPDEELLHLFVDDNRLRELFELIEALQEEVVESVRGERRQSDTYQDELLQASNLLMQSRENYDEARAIVYRIRADMNRDRRVERDIARFRPLITSIYIGMAIFVAVLALLGQLFISVIDSAGAPWIAQGYYPALAGAVGALLFGWRSLGRHTTIDHDFDPTYVTEYIIIPLKGLAFGFLCYLLLLGTTVSPLNSNTIEITGIAPITLILACLVGYNQNVVSALLDSVRQRLLPGNTNQPRQEDR